ncbi:MAG: heavy metal-responsive transcriptional regulator [Pseudomonadota bacterium]|nr:MAG: heavy metal-responsive transcriptional regulator [Pseudomonadota bacterium]
MKPLSIGQLAKAAGVSVETVRFYERKGLLPKPRRSASGYRQYSEESVRRLRFVQRAKDVGFTLGEIGELLALRTEPNASCADVRARAATKIALIDEKLTALSRMKRALGQLAERCTGEGPVSGCPILDALETDEGKHDANS